MFCFDGDRLGILKKKAPTDFNRHDLMDPKKKSIDTASRHIFYLFAQSMSGKLCLPVPASQPPIGYNGSTWLRTVAELTAFSFHRLLLLHFNIPATDIFFWKPVEGANSKDTTLKITEKKSASVRINITISLCQCYFLCFSMSNWTAVTQSP